MASNENIRLGFLFCNNSFLNCCVSAAYWQRLKDGSDSKLCCEFRTHRKLATLKTNLQMQAMAVRANMLEINDLENGIKQCRKELADLHLFESSQTISSEEKKEADEERRKINMCLQNYVSCKSSLEKENVIVILIYFFLLFFIVLGHYWLDNPTDSD